MDPRDRPIDLSRLRNSVGAIRLAVSMLRADDAPWLAELAGPTQVQLRSVLQALHAATAELVVHVSADAGAIASETARALQERDRPAPAVQGRTVASLASVLARLEVVTAVAPAPRPLLALDLEGDASIGLHPDVLLSALQAAVFGLVRSRPVLRRPWTIQVQSRSDRDPGGGSLVVLLLRCEVADDSMARGPGAGLSAALPGWLHECLRIADAVGGSLTRGRDGAHEVVRMVLPALPHTSAASLAAANESAVRRRIA